MTDRRRLAALAAVFGAVVLVGLGLALLGGVQGYVKPMSPSFSPSPSVAPPSPSAPVATVTEPHPDFVVTPGAFCDHEGANGASKDGKPMRCVRRPGEDRARWRADP